MRSFAQFLIQFRVAIVLGVIALSAAASVGLPVDYDDDVIRFLPADDPEVQRLDQITERFGSTNIVLIGIETDGLYTNENLQYVRTLTNELVDKVDLVEKDKITSISHLSVMKEGGGLTKVVPDPIPSDPAELAKAKEFIQGLDYIVGRLISESGRSTRIVVQLKKVNDDGSKVSPQRAAEAIRAAALEHHEAANLPNIRLHFGGAPFIAEAAVRGSQEDLKRLSPYLVGIILLLILLIVGSLRGSLLIVVAVGISIWWTVGIMGLLGFPFTLISSSLPVILFALGSAYAVHLLVWYLEHDNDVEDMLSEVGWPVLVTALTTMAGFASFLLMDLEPMREFGWQMVLGTAMCALVALVVIPITLTFWPLAKTEVGRVGAWVDRMLLRLTAFSRHRRKLVVIGGVLVAAFFGLQIQHINTSMDPQTFFPEGSEPDRANKFMKREFGASVFLSVMVEADMADPAVIKRLGVFEDRVEALDGVASVDSIGRVLAVARQAMGKPRLLSYQRDENDFLGKQARAADAGVQLLVSKGWKSAMVQVGIGVSDTSRVAAITAEIRRLGEEILVGQASFEPRNPGRLEAVYSDAAERLVSLFGAKRENVEEVKAVLKSSLSKDAQTKMRKALEEAADEWIVNGFFDVKEDLELDSVVDKLMGDLLSFRLSWPSFFAYVRTIAAAKELTLKDPKKIEGFENAVGLAHTKIRAAAYPFIPGDWVQRLEAKFGKLGVARRHRVAQIIDECLRPFWARTTPGGEGDGASVKVSVSGMPVIEEAMTRSVRRNQVNSLLFSLPLVLLILCWVFRSVLLGLIGLVPTALTLLVTFGLMGLFPEHLPLDIGASMIASIGLGVGIDYAIHFIWRYQRGGLESAMATTGRSIVVNAAEITAGFSVLAFATISPMAKFGILTAETLFVAATATLLLLPALLEWLSPVNNAKAR